MKKYEISTAPNELIRVVHISGHHIEKVLAELPKLDYIDSARKVTKTSVIVVLSKLADDDDLVNMENIIKNIAGE